MDWRDQPDGFFVMDETTSVPPEVWDKIELYGKTKMLKPKMSAAAARELLAEEMDAIAIGPEDRFVQLRCGEDGCGIQVK